MPEKASDRNQMGIVGFLRLGQKETQDAAAGTRMLRRGLLTAVGKPTFPPFPSPYFFASDYVSKLIRCRTDSSRAFAKVVAPRGDNIVIQLCPMPESENIGACIRTWLMDTT